MIINSEPTRRPPGLLERLRLALRARHYSPRTEQAYLGWIRRYIAFHERRHPRELGAQHVEAFLDHIAAERSISPSTQNQALSALLFLHQVLERDIQDFRGVARAKRPERVPVVLSLDEVRALLAEMAGVTGLVARIFYGAGLRLSECTSLRIKDVDLTRNEIRVRDGKGRKDRASVSRSNPASRGHFKSGQSRDQDRWGLT